MELQQDFLGLTLTGVMSYREYALRVQQLAEAGKTSGVDQKPEHIPATKLNAQRMKRIEKQCVINDEIANELAALNDKWKWILLAESWCGDGAQNSPIIAKIASLYPGKIELQIVHRDENAELMNAYLTNNARAIPKLVCWSETKGKVIGTWGPRPDAIREKVIEFKRLNPTVSHEEFVKNVHLWYAQDKGASLQNDFLKLLRAWK